MVDAIRNIASRNKEVFGVNLGRMRDEIDRMTGWVNQLMNLWEQGAFDQAAAAHISFRTART